MSSARHMRASPALAGAAGERNGPSDATRYVYIYVCMYVCMYIYIYIYSDATCDTSLRSSAAKCDRPQVAPGGKRSQSGSCVSSYRCLV